MDPIAPARVRARCAVLERFAQLARASRRDSGIPPQRGSRGDLRASPSEIHGFTLGTAALSPPRTPHSPGGRRPASARSRFLPPGLARATMITAGIPRRHPHAISGGWTQGYFPFSGNEDWFGRHTYSGGADKASHLSSTTACLASFTSPTSAWAIPTTAPSRWPGDVHGGGPDHGARQRVRRGLRVLLRGPRHGCAGRGSRGFHDAPRPRRRRGFPIRPRSGAEAAALLSLRRNRKGLLRGDLHGGPQARGDRTEAPVVRAWRAGSSPRSPIPPRGTSTPTRCIASSRWVSRSASTSPRFSGPSASRSRPGGGEASSSSSTSSAFRIPRSVLLRRHPRALVRAERRRAIRSGGRAAAACACGRG